MFVFLFSNITYSQEKQKVNNSSDKEIVQMLKNFYKEYVSESDKMPMNEKKINLIKKRYCTSNLLNKIELLELDYDPFVDAQDFNSTLLKTIEFTKDKKNNNNYKACYVWDFNKKIICVKLSIKKVNKTYKIDDIIGLK